MLDIIVINLENFKFKDIKSLNMTFCITLKEIVICI